jgi:hypothetical protein
LAALTQFSVFDLTGSAHTSSSGGAARMVDVNISAQMIAGDIAALA